MVDLSLAELRDRFQRLGVAEADAAAAAAYELESNTPALATETLLKLCWHRLIDGHNRPGALSGIPAARRLGNAGASVDDLRLFARGVAFETLFGLFYLLSEGPNHALRDALGIEDGDYPGWSIVETDAEGAQTGRTLHCVYEGLRISDPSGNEGRDFFED